MFGRGSKDEGAPVRKAVSPTEIETIVGPNAYLRGDIQSDGGARVEGVFEGTIDVTGNLVIGEGAKVIADIKANNISIAGAVKGDISANKVEILDNGRVWGNLKVSSLLLNEGAYLRGQTTMAGDVEPPMIEAPKRPEEKPEAGPAKIVDVEPKAKEPAEPEE
ncbi:MAG: polymer-forming cytoskeletal protein [Chloroflexota bacterium]|nr:polymer-forming cytoskeletal protein [Chloroflexota bacterium]